MVGNSMTQIVLSNIIESVLFLMAISLFSGFSIIAGCICLMLGKGGRSKDKVSPR
jgi:hypothetical protein